MTQTQKAFLLILFILQVTVASGFELAHDEAYYWLYSKNLAWGYFDHPPFVGVIIKLFSFLPHSEIAVRIGFILLQFGTLGIILKLTRPEFYTRIIMLYFAFPLASFTGLLALPDMPLLFMTALYVLFLERFLEKEDLVSVIGLSLSIPLLLYAKYHGILLVFFTILALPQLLKKKNFYLIALISIILFLPHLWWQYEHDFSTLRYHFIERPSSSFSLSRSFEYIVVQIILAGLLAGPLIWWRTLKFKSQNAFERVLKVIALGIVCFFFVSSLSKKVEANWTISATVPLILLFGRSRFKHQNYVNWTIGISFFTVILARFLFVLPVENFTQLKRIKEFKGWESWSDEMKSVCGKDKKLLANSYQIASKLSFYLDENIQAMNINSRKNQFDYWRFDHNYPTSEVCYLTDDAQAIGERIRTPEGKTLTLVSNLRLEDLQALKEVKN